MGHKYRTETLYSLSSQRMVLADVWHSTEQWRNTSVVSQHEPEDLVFLCLVCDPQGLVYSDGLGKQRSWVLLNWITSFPRYRTSVQMLGEPSKLYANSEGWEILPWIRRISSSLCLRHILPLILLQYVLKVAKQGGFEHLYHKAVGGAQGFLSRGSLSMGSSFVQEATMLLVGD